VTTRGAFLPRSEKKLYALCPFLTLIDKEDTGRTERMPSAPMNRVIYLLRRAIAPPGDEDDGELLRRFLIGGEGAAFAGLVRRHGPMVFGVCRRVLDDVHDAEDAYQATFLVLARKAASVRKPQALASWLYGVAYRVACRTRAAVQRHRITADAAPPVSSSDPVAEAAWRELRPVIDEELNRLPEKYRAPLVLCYLQGKTNEEAAQLLGWPKGTVSGRLARARDLLRPRLARRGVALLTGGLVVLLAQGAAPAPAALVETTVQAALGGGVPAPAAALAEGVLRAMFVSQLMKWTVVATLGLVLAGAGVMWQYRSVGAGEPGAAQAGEDDAPSARAKERPGLLFTVPDDPKKAPEDQQRMQGAWRAITLEHNGDKFTPEATRKFRLIIKGNTITFNPDTENRQATFRLDPTQKPKTIWLTPKGASAADRRVTGIYDVEDYRLRICVDNDEGKEIPTDFATRAGSGLTLIVLQRDADVEAVGAASTPEDKPRLILEGSKSPVRAVAFGPDGRVVAGCAEDGSAYCWDVVSGKLRYQLSGEGHACRALAFSPDGRLVAVGGVRNRKDGDVGTARVLDAATGKLLMDMVGSGGAVNAVAFRPDGTQLMTAGSDGTLRLWDLARGKERVAFRVDEGAITAVAFSPDGKSVASSGVDGSVRVWEPETGKELRALLIGQAGVVATVRFSPDGRLILTAGPDGSTRLWDVATGKELRRFEAHAKGVRSAAFSPNGRLAAAAGAGGQVKLWDLSTGQELASYAADTKAVNTVAFSPDGKVVASGGADGMVKLWDVGR
jgi:RNA polymerase sigma factor (sigma-70 family)